MDVLDWGFLLGLIVCILIGIIVTIFSVMIWTMIYHEQVKDHPLYKKGEKFK